MAEYDRQTDEYGNTVNRPGAGGGTDAYGTPTDDQYGVSGNTGGRATHGTTGTCTGTHGTTGTGEYGAGGGGHRRSGSSSSSEDDGEGGRRKKGLKDKIKEKLPGGKSSEEDTYSTTSTGTGGVGYEEEHHEKTKGMMEKIKEKLPGHH